MSYIRASNSKSSFSNKPISNPFLELFDLIWQYQNQKKKYNFANPEESYFCQIPLISNDQMISFRNNLDSYYIVYEDVSGIINKLLEYFKDNKIQLHGVITILYHSAAFILSKNKDQF